MTISNNNNLERAADWISRADALVIAAGAGMGVDSGLPDFRGSEGFWNAYPALGKQKINFHDIANPAAFVKTPKLAWGFYGHRLNLYRRTQPHAGFAMLKKWGEGKSCGYNVFTSNVDGQFQKAGFNEQAIHECHGSIHHLQCSESCCDEVWPADEFLPDVDEDNCLLRNALPQCKHCGALVRPNILMFGDAHWLQSRARVQAARQDRWLARAQRPVVVELGAGAAIPSVRRFSEWVVHRYGGRLIRINVQDSAVKEKHGVGIALTARAALTEIDEILQSP
ncbi:MAG: hypothetical protein QG652_108 [Pseudomonadota bacterium]|nr:hypothetical protein [Pseudomonadota bacterium]